MTALVWDSIGSRRYENGIERGVLYLNNDQGVAWNGLTSFTEDVGGQEVTPLYFDGRKHFDYVSPKNFSGVIRAYTYPDEFLDLEGIATSSNGLLIDNQVKKTFGLSYRTKINNDLSESVGYKIHILYGLTAVPNDLEYATLNDSIEPIEFEWKVTGRPVYSDGFRPSSHVIVDSTKIDSDLLNQIETILYGSFSTTARLPYITELFSLVSNGSTIVITDNGDGTWTATGSDSDITMLDSTTFQITNANATFTDANTYNVSSS